MKPANIYESDETKLNQEAERLSSFDLPNQVSINAIGEIRAETKFLDVGAGSNTVLGKYVSEHNGVYTALDKNQSFLDIQKAKGVIAIHGDAREMPLSTNSFDISHVRFVIAHLGQDKENAIQETLRVTKQGGSAIFLDFDWTTAHGSKDFDNFRDFMINSGFRFDASFGAFLDTAVRLAITNDQASITAKRFSPERMFDYSQALKLREAGIADLKVQGKEDKVQTWENLLDILEEESKTQSPPGFFFPDIAIVTAKKIY